MGFLLPFIFFLQKPVPGEWSKVFGKDYATDGQIFMGLVGLCSEHDGARTTMAFGILSGVFAFLYNIVQFTIVHTLSPSATAFGGNFNKAALTFMTLLLPFLQTKKLPKMPYIAWEWIAVLGNVAAFSFYSYLQILAKQKQKEESEQKEAMLDKREMVPVQYQGSDDDEDDDDDDEEGECC